MIARMLGKANDLKMRLGTGRRDPDGWALVQSVRHERLTYLEPQALLDLRERVRQIEQAGAPGSIIEAGCALGGSAVVLARSKAQARPMYVYDVFGTIPPPSERDGADVHARYVDIAAGTATGIGGNAYYGYMPELKQQVTRTFEQFGVPVATSNVELVEGLFEDTLHPGGPVSLAHVDSDWYDSVTVCLERIWPVLSVGGAVVVDDYDAWSGCREAVNDFLQGRSDCQWERRARLHLVKA